ncbi:MAG: hypothetical protein HKN91_15685 [Acidimicrobiia bacterium]|nr:hypothetical protein [Acidimicrobiia bacterium]
MSRPGRAAVVIAALFLVTAACDDSTPSAAEISPGLELTAIGDIPEHGVLYVPRQRVYVVDSPTEGYLALYEKSPDLGCKVTDLFGDGASSEPPATTSPLTRFFDYCHGSEFDMEGTYVAGRSPRSLSRFPLTLVGDTLYIRPGSELELVPRPSQE